jgi:serine/threonine protein kinase
MADRLPSAITARFQVQGAYASGSTGTLYRATDTTTQKTGLLKVVHSASQLTPSERGRLVRELEKLVSLHHPSLANIHAAGSAEDLPWLFRELIEGESLEARLAKGPVPSGEALGIAAQIASGLDELHRAGLLQRDLSPSHIVLREGSPQAVLIDSGIAGRIPTAALFEVSGKPEYVSPEHAQGKLVSFRSDLYSLGAVLFEMVTGNPVYQGSADEVLEAQRAQPAPQVPPGIVPSNIASLLGQLLAKEPRERPFSAQQVRRALEPFLPTGLPQAPPAGAAAKKTLLGVPSPVQRPRADQTEELSSLDIVRAEAVLRGEGPRAQPPPTPRADATMPLSVMDLAKAEAVLKSVPPKTPAAAMPPRTDGTMPLFAKDLAPRPGPSGKSMPPPPPAAAPAKQPTAPPPPPAAAMAPSQRPPAPNATLAGMPIPAAAAVPVIAPGPSASDLDYDDLAETKARDVEGVSPFAPTVEGVAVPRDRLGHHHPACRLRRAESLRCADLGTQRGQHGIWCAGCLGIRTELGTELWIRSHERGSPELSGRRCAAGHHGDGRDQRAFLAARVRGEL